MVIVEADARQKLFDEIKQACADLVYLYIVKRRWTGLGALFTSLPVTTFSFSKVEDRRVFRTQIGESCLKLSVRDFILEQMDGRPNDILDTVNLRAVSDQNAVEVRLTFRTLP
jgi:hypothetical protein